MLTAQDKAEQFPHIGFHEVEGRREAYLVDSGLAIWEIAWLSRSYCGDARAIAENHTVVTPDLIEEGLRYATEHAEEIDAEVSRHTDRPLEDLLEMFPDMRIITFDVDEVDGHHV